MIMPRQASEGNTRERSGVTLRILIGAPVLLGFAICAVSLLVSDGEAQSGPVQLLGSGIDEYLGQLYGKDSKASVKLSLAGSQLVDGAALRKKVHSRKHDMLSMSNFAQGLGLKNIPAQQDSSITEDYHDNRNSSPMESLKEEEALDAAAEGVSLKARQPCDGKPCFAVINGLHK